MFEKRHQYFFLFQLSYELFYYFKMSEEERRIEASLDAERYRDLNALQDQDLHEGLL